MKKRQIHGRLLRSLTALLLTAVLLTGSALAAGLPAGQETQVRLTITGVPDGKLVKGDQFTLSVSGGSGSGAVTWSVVDGPATIDINGTVTITGEGAVTIRAQKAGDDRYAAAEATITFDTSGPTGFSVTFHVSDSSTWTAGSGSLQDLLKLPDFLNPSGGDGLLFGGWYLDPEYTVEFDLNSPILGDLTLYAKWVPAETRSLLSRVLSIF